MTHPLILSRPLLIHALAAVLLCPVAFAKPKSLSQKQTPSAKQSQQVKQPPVKQPPAKQPPAAKLPETNKPAPAALSSAAKKQTLAPAKGAARQTQGDGPPQPQKPDHRSLIVDPAELLSRVPASGPLNEEHLILLAIAKDPRLAALRADIVSKIAERRRQQDWENPELRVSYGSQDDDFLRDPFTERIVEQSKVTETFSGDDKAILLRPSDEDPEGPPVVEDPGNQTLDTITGGTTTSDRTRVIDRLVTPRRDGGEDRRDTIISDTRTDITTATRFRQNFVNGRLVPDPAQTHQISETTTTGLAPGSVFSERTTGPGGSNAQETVSALLRFQMPHPWQKRARVQRASAEISLAEAKYLSEEDKLVRDVRELFQALAVLEGTHSSQQKRRQNYTSLIAELETSDEADLATEGLRAQLEMGNLYNDMLESVSDADRTRAELAWLCGLPGSERIRTGGVITRRLVDLATLDPNYLLEMAMLYRADMIESNARLEIAKAFLAEADAAKIPWATFIDAGWSRQWRDGHSGAQDEWMVRLGIEIPLFDWIGINKRSKEYRKAATAWGQQLETQRDRISAQVDLALARLRKAASSLRTYEAAIGQDQHRIVDTLAKLDAIGDFAKNKRFKYDAENLIQSNEIQRLRLYFEYNRALMALEDAIGVRVEKVLNGWRDK